MCNYASIGLTKNNPCYFLDSLRIEKSEDIRNNEKGKVTRAELLNEITRLRKELEGKLQVI